MNAKSRAHIASWIALVLKGFLPAILIYFLALKPLIGVGYGVVYTLFYLFVFCPMAVVLLQPYLLKKSADRKKTAEEGKKLAS